MPPKPKFTREEVISVALELFSEKGMEALTSRDLRARLGSSARPIFTFGIGALCASGMCNFSEE